jgi:voltage-gated sodium channel
MFNYEVANISFLLIFRVLRLFKTFRFLKFVPGIEQLLQGIQRALKSSVIVLFGLFIYIFIIGIFSFYLFNSKSPEFFSNPLTSFYSIFRIFTIEGWFEIPDSITKNLSPVESFFTYCYFIFILLTGGIFGLSLVNSIFVDAMVTDNTDSIENKISEIDKKIEILLEQKKTDS